MGKPRHLTHASAISAAASLRIKATWAARDDGATQLHLMSAAYDALSLH